MNINIPEQREVILHYGQDNQFGIHMEECAELIQAVSKARRWIATSDTATIHPSIVHDLVEEMADVLICMKQLQEIFHITDERLEQEVKAKFERQLERMKAEGGAYEYKGNKT